MNLISLKNEDKVVEKIEQNDKIILKMKYGVIRIIGEENMREITLKTLNYLKNLPQGFNGQVEIKELNLTVPVNQIVKLEEKESEAIEYKNFTKLPTETLCLDLDFNILKEPRIKIEREYDSYYLATCHYVENDGEKQYYLSTEQIPYLVTMQRDEDPDYPHYVKKALRYGRDVREIRKEQEKKNKK